LISEGNLGLYSLVLFVTEIAGQAELLLPNLRQGIPDGSFPELPPELREEYKAD